MENNKEAKGHVGVCNCMGCTFFQSNHSAIKTLFFIAFVMAVFCFGVKLGEMKSYSHMMRSHHKMMMYGDRGGMMRNDQEFNYRIIQTEDALDTQTPATPPQAQ